MRNCAIIHPLHLELETAHPNLTGTTNTALPGWYSQRFPGKPRRRLALPLPKDGIESRYLCHFTRREGMHGVNLTLAGTKNRKPILWKQRF
jgi:hypothetical protein